MGETEVNEGWKVKGNEDDDTTNAKEKNVEKKGANNEQHDKDNSSNHRYDSPLFFLFVFLNFINNTQNTQLYK